MSEHVKSIVLSSRIYEVILLLCLAGFVFLIYSNNLNGPFIFDDDINIKDNPHIRITEFTITSLSDAGFKGPNSDRPVANISFALNYFFHHFDVFGYHLVNNLVHIINGILLYFFVKTILGLTNTPYHSTIAFFTAMLWLCHPIQTQSVTYIVQRMNSLATMFYIGSFLLYIKARLLFKRKNSERTRRKWVYLLGSVIAAVMALGSKQTAATLPFFILLFELYFIQKLRFGLNRRHLYLILVVSILFGLIILLSYLGTDPFKSIMRLYEYREFTPTQRVLTQFRVVVLYMSLLLIPHPSRLNLAHDISLSYSLINPITTLISMVLIIGLIILAIVIAKKDPLISFCILWFFGNLVIESSVIGLEIIYEHRTYLPSMLFVMMVVIIFFRYFRFRWAKYAIICSVILVFSVWTYQRNEVWADDMILWKDCVEKSPNLARPHHNFGLALAKRGYLKDAMEHYSRALDIQPDRAIIHVSMGDALSSLGRIEEARKHYERGIELNPNNPKVFNNFGFLYVRLKEFEKAIQYFKRAISIDRLYADVHDNIAYVYLQLGQVDKSIHHYRETLRLRPHSSGSYNNLGYALARMGYFDEAIQYYRTALEINPEDALALKNLRLAMMSKGE